MGTERLLISGIWYVVFINYDNPNPLDSNPLVPTELSVAPYVFTRSLRSVFTFMLTPFIRRHSIDISPFPGFVYSFMVDKFPLLEFKNGWYVFMSLCWAQWFPCTSNSDAELPAGHLYLGIPRTPPTHTQSWFSHTPVALSFVGTTSDLREHMVLVDTSPTQPILHQVLFTFSPMQTFNLCFPIFLFLLCYLRLSCFLV